jgi:hypothetical protein
LTCNTATNNGFRSVCELTGNFSPSDKADILNMADVEEEHSLFGKRWEELNEEQQVKLLYLVSRKQYTMLRRVPDPVAALTDALDTETPSGQRLHALIRKGNDLFLPMSVNEATELAGSAYDAFLRQGNECWRDDRDNFPTIFNDPNRPNMKPLLWTRTEPSTVCNLVISTLALFYRNRRKNNETSNDDMAAAAEQSALNISRLLRDMFTNEEIFDYVFNGKARSPYFMMKRIFKTQSIEREKFTIVNIFPKPYPSNMVFSCVGYSIRDHGALIIENFKYFPGLDQMDGRTRYDGDWNDPKFHNDWKDVVGFDRHNPPLHALLIVGVGRANKMNECLPDKVDGTEPEYMDGVAFLVQNLSENKPFVVVGLDLLRSMGVDEVIALARGLTFATDEVNDANFPEIFRVLHEEELARQEGAASMWKCFDRINIQTLANKRS